MHLREGVDDGDVEAAARVAAGAGQVAVGDVRVGKVDGRVAGRGLHPFGGGDDERGDRVAAEIEETDLVERREQDQGHVILRRILEVVGARAELGAKPAGVGEDDGDLLPDPVSVGVVQGDDAGDGAAHVVDGRDRNGGGGADAAQDEIVGIAAGRGEDQQSRQTHAAHHSRRKSIGIARSFDAL